MAASAFVESSSAVVSGVGLLGLSLGGSGWATFASATVFAVGVCYFWPTMLGVVSEQCPRGGALTLNAIAGIGMLTVGIVGGPLIGKMQEDSAVAALKDEKSDIAESLTVERQYFLGAYTAVDSEKVAALDNGETKEGEESESSKVNDIVKRGKQSALANITIFPIFMLGCYIALGVYFKGRGGYKAVDLSDDDDSSDGDDDSTNDDKKTDDS